VVKNRLLGTSLLVVIALIGQSSSVANAANAVGKTCTKVGKISKSTFGDQLVCEKSGKKLIWKKKIAPPLPVVIDLSKTSSLSPENLFSEVSKCKITDASYSRDVSLGFPRPVGIAASKSTYKALVIPVSFLDAPFTDYDLEYLKENVAEVNQYYKLQSLEKIQISFTYPEKSKWVTFSDQRSDHGLATKIFLESKQSLVSEVLAKTDSDLRVTEYDFLLVQTAIWADSGWGMAFPTSSFSTPSGQVKSTVFLAGFSAGQWFVIAHEIGHALFAFEDLYSYAATKDRTFAFSGTKNWDLMSNAGGFYLGLFSWQRFLTGWIQDSQVACLSNTGNYQIYLAPLDLVANVQKSVQIPLEPGVILVAESRKTSKYDSRVGIGGTLVYVVNTQINSGSEPITVLGFLAKGQTATYKNVEITSLDSNSTGELVSVKIS
jgi:M6 family metalloprotease-like protein